MVHRLRHILFIIPSLQGGGAERVIATLVKYLDRSKFQLTLAVIDMRNAVYAEGLPDDVKIVDLSCNRVRFSLLSIVKLISKCRPDVVFSTLGHLNLALAAIRPLLPNRVRFVARETVVVSENIYNYEWPLLWRWAYRFLYTKLDVVVCQSKDMHDDLVKNFSLPLEKAIVINNPVDVARIQRLSLQSVTDGSSTKSFSGNNGALQIVAAGRLCRQKGFDLLLNALALCDRADLQLTILGDGGGADEVELKLLATTLGIEDRVCFAGFQRNPYPYFLAADAYVLSSRFEGFPNVVLEALACGTPVLALPCPGGVREILSDVPGCALGRDVSVDALVELLQGVQKRRALDSADVAKRFGVDKIVREYETMLLSGLSP